MFIYTVQLGQIAPQDDGSTAFLPWMEFTMFDEALTLDTWLSAGHPNNTNWPYTGEWFIKGSDKVVALHRSDGGKRLARLHYDRWPWKKGSTGKVTLSEPFDGKFSGAYIVTSVS